MHKMLTGKESKSEQHNERSSNLLNRIGKTIIAIFVVAWMLPSASTHAVSGYLTSFENAYPAARGSRIDSCSLCHTSVPARNSYGSAFASAGRTYSAALAALDSDGDTYNNAAEIAALTFPGDKLDLPAPPADTVAPVVSFTLPATATSLSVNVLSFSATDSGGVTGYLLNESSTKPLASAAGWSTTPPGGFTFPAAGTRTLYAWAKDAANNVSTGVGRTIVITLPPAPDTVAPVVSFTLPATATSLSVNVLSFSATDSGGVTGYLLNESSAKPLASAAGWSTTPPGGFTFPAAGTRTLYAWAKDAANNVSTGVGRTIVITLPPAPDTEAPQVISFTLPTSATSLSVNVQSFSVTDNVGVTGYLLNESSTRPLASAAGWSTTPPGGFTFPAAGTRTLYAWAKDAANNVSTGVSRTIVITLTAPPPPPPPPPPPSIDGLLFSDSFTDATKTGDPDWASIKGSFGGVRGAFTALGRRDNLALVEGVAGLDPFAGGRIEVTVLVANGEKQTTADVIFDYQDEQNYRYVRLDRMQKRVVVGQVGTPGLPQSGGGEEEEEEDDLRALDGRRGTQDTQLAASARLPRAFFTSRSQHQLRVDLDAGAGSVTVYLDQDEAPAATAVFDTTGIGRVGLAANRARLRVSFDDFQVWDGSVLP